jgi:hypothetical protein
LEIDKDIYTYDYINEQIFTAQYPVGDELNYSHGKIINKKIIISYIMLVQKMVLQAHQLYYLIN